MSLETILAQAKQIKAQLAEALKPELAEQARAVFADERIRAIRWTQYTPYFNDGDPCIFRVNQDSCLDIGTGEFQDSYSCALGEKESAPVRAFERFIAQDELSEVFKDAFGDHVEVTIKRDGTVETEEYEHD